MPRRLSDNLADLREWEPKIRQAFAALPELADVNSDQQVTTLY
jgi:multidrug efflux pump